MLGRAGKESQEVYNTKFKVREPGIGPGDRVYIKGLTPKKRIKWKVNITDLLG